ncbi:bifunctional phosphoribosyl-AMP cyclohydrolase/phosphoribosyl-ATP diphosphatase HisIE [Herpetosiphon geysericola]|uniref:Histidine biosynthesis bifunctional protein HisIE n=1 Tax=Herpetosiphon geysericola TaxID=70996 RepID=A0A0N8GSC2_9CHLR|nr:bifunctional phosphoribosyl-AMP cyclohydrolase/phosphoribosyl-ATP diphosphatase HisIE [Herpetosiphon geysericola]KPL88890.1 imidazole glycerol phosphate synthase [Herpetosiphon geysericola]
MVELTYDSQGLIPAVVQHARSGEVLMVGYMNAEALAKTQTSGLVTFWSRSRQELWTKGETSGNVLKFIAARTDCDNDALLILAEPSGPTCHTGERSCFHTTLDGTKREGSAVPLAFVSQLFEFLREREQTRPIGSYTTYLLEKGVDKIGKKIGEESAEVIIAAKNGNPDELRNEASDLIYHLFVLLLNQGVSPEDVWFTLRERHGRQREEKQ